MQIRKLFTLVPVLACEPPGGSTEAFCSTGERASVFPKAI
jgi:hypothetical protein